MFPLLTVETINVKSKVEAMSKLSQPHVVNVLIKSNCLDYLIHLDTQLLTLLVTLIVYIYIWFIYLFLEVTFACERKHVTAWLRQTRMSNIYYNKYISSDAPSRGHLSTKGTLWVFSPINWPIKTSLTVNSNNILSIKRSEGVFCI